MRDEDEILKLLARRRPMPMVQIAPPKAGPDMEPLPAPNFMPQMQPVVFADDDPSHLRRDVGVLAKRGMDELTKRRGLPTSTATGSGPLPNWATGKDGPKTGAAA